MLSESCVKKPKGVLIPKVVDYDEPCIRCLTDPLFYNFKKKKFNPNAVLPPANKDRRDVSLFRLRYTSMDVCKERGEALAVKIKNSFCGLASWTLKDVKDTNTEQQNTGINADIVYSPMHDEEYVDPKMDVYVADPDIDLPDHADMMYNIPYNKSDVVNTPFRMYANSLLKRVKTEFLKDSL